MVSHLFVGILGVGLGIYLLPILTAPASLSDTEIRAIVDKTLYTATFTRDIEGSDALHWGEGEVSIGEKNITFIGSLAPGPDYKLYLSPEFVSTESEFKRLKKSMIQVGEVNTFDNFVVHLTPGIDVAKYSAVVVWCESFNEFITAGSYR